MLNGSISSDVCCCTLISEKNEKLPLVKLVEWPRLGLKKGLIRASKLYQHCLIAVRYSSRALVMRSSLLRCGPQFTSLRIAPFKRFITSKKSDLALPAAHHQLLSLKPITPSDSYVSCTVFNEKGDVTAVSQKFPKWAFLRDHSLYPRDLRKIDATAIDIIPSIIVKSSCIVFNMLHIKALIEKDRVYVFDTANPSAAAKLGVLMYDLEAKLSMNNRVSMNTVTQYYEHRALESMLINVMSSLETDFKTHSKLCGQILTDLENEVNRDKLRDLLIKSKDLTLFYQKSLLIREVLDELLESDDDLAGMYLTVKKKEQDDDFADLEMLLETYYTQCDEYVQQAESLIQDIRSTEEIVNIILDANRNSLMLLELKVTIYTLGFTVATLLPAFYGMNLENFIEESNLGFAGVVLVSIAAGIMVTGANFKALRSVTRLTMLNNHSGAQSVRHQQLASKYAEEHIPSLWQRWGQWTNLVWNGRTGVAQRAQDKKDRDIVWKWLLDDEKK